MRSQTLQQQNAKSNVLSHQFPTVDMLLKRSLKLRSSFRSIFFPLFTCVVSMVMQPELEFPEASLLTARGRLSVPYVTFSVCSIHVPRPQELNFIE